MPVIKDPAKRERNSLRLFGCSEAESIAINGGAPTRDPSSAAVRYLHQRTTAGLRGIEWAISFPEWMRIWLNSGHWADRGVGVGRYCMARHGDTGPYSAANVSIQLCTENSRDGIRKARALSKVERLAEELSAGSYGIAQGSRMTFPVARPKAQPAPSPRIRIVSTDRRYIGFHITNREEGRKESDKRAALVKGGL